MRFDRTITVPEGGLAVEQADPLPSDLADRVDCMLIPEEALQQRVSGLAKNIHEACQESSELILLVVLKGAFVFAADLGREISRLAGWSFATSSFARAPMAIPSNSRMRKCGK